MRSRRKKSYRKWLILWYPKFVTVQLVSHMFLFVEKWYNCFESSYCITRKNCKIITPLKLISHCLPNLVASSCNQNVMINFIKSFYKRKPQITTFMKTFAISYLQKHVHLWFLIHSNQSGWLHICNKTFCNVPEHLRNCSLYICYQVKEQNLIIPTHQRSFVISGFQF